MHMTSNLFRRIWLKITEAPSFLVSVACLLGFMFSVLPAAAEDAVKIATVVADVVKLNVRDRSDIRFRRLSLSEGLSQTRVAQMVQADDGRIWFGTQNGVSRYDGYKFQVFKHIQGDMDSLSGIYIYALFKDRAGTIWVASDQFLDAFDDRTGTFRHYQIAPDSPTIRHISQDADGVLWLSTSRGLYRFDVKTGSTKLFSHDPSDPNGLSSSDVKSSGVDRHGTFWVADSEGLEALNRETGKVTIRIPLRQEVNEFSFHEDAHGTFWIISAAGNGLAIYDRQANVLTRYTFDQLKSDSGLSGVHSLLEAHDGNIWLSTMGSGLLKFDRTNFAFDRYKNEPNNPQSLKENRAISLFEDRENNIWVGLHASPPNMFYQDPPAFRTLWPSPGHVSQFGETLVNAVLQDRDGSVWLGAGGALVKLDPSGGNARLFAPSGPGSSVEILTIAQGSTGLIWIGTLGSGLFSFDPITESFKSYRYLPGGDNNISSDTVTRIYIETSGLMWLSTWNGLNSFEPATERFNNYKNLGSSYEAYFSIAAEGDRYLWLGTTEGFAQFDRNSKKFRYFRHDPENPKSLSNNTVDTVFLAPDNTVWIGTQNGLNKLDKITGTFRAFFEKDGLPGNAVSCILGDPLGNLWMSTNHGVSKMDPRTERFENYSSEDGLPGDDLTGWDACTVGNNGELYFGGFVGAAVKSGDEVDRDTRLLPVIITDVETGDLLKNSLFGRQQPIVLPSDSRSITVGFATPSFRSTGGTRYRYQLTGLDSDWHIANGNQRQVSFAALPPGNFKFRVQAATKRGSWETPETTLDINVLPHWWNTGWFYGVISLLILLIIASTYRYRVGKVAAQYNLRFKERMNERNRVARDLHDTLLQSLQGLTFRLHAARHLLPGKPEEAASMLDIVLEKSDDAIVESRNAVEALRDTKQSDVDLVQAIKALGLELLSLRATVEMPKFEARSFGKVAELEPIVREEIYRIVSEALRNAFKHSQAASIECDFYFSSSTLRIVVSDNGSGFPSDPRPKAPSVRGWGIAGMKERASKIGASLIMESQSGHGTRMELTIALRPAPRPIWRRFVF